MLAAFLEQVRSPRIRLAIGMLGLILLVKRSPPEVESLFQLTVAWSQGMWRFLSDPENTVGLLFVIQWVWPTSEDIEAQRHTASDG